MRVLHVLLAFLCFVSTAFAQIPTRGTVIGKGYADFSVDELVNIRDLYFSGDWESLQSNAKRVLSSLQLKAAGNSSEAAFDFQKHYYQMVFVFLGPDQKKKEILRFVVHDGLSPYVLRIPGIKGNGKTKLYEVFLTLEPRDVLVSTYLATRERNPLEALIPKFVKQFDPKEILELTAAANQKRIHAVLSRIDLPFERARLRLKT